MNRIPTLRIPRPLRARHLGTYFALAFGVATLQAGAQPAKPLGNVEVACHEPAPPDVLTAFGQPAVLEFWQARQRLALWERRDDIKPLLDDVQKASRDAMVYFGTLEQVANSRSPSFSEMPANLRRFVLERAAENAALRGSPETYVARVSELLTKGGDTTIADYIKARRAATAAVEAQPPMLDTSADPVAAASTLERQLDMVWTTHCMPRLRVLSQLTLAPVPTNFFLRNEPAAATFMTPAVPELLKMHHEKATSLVDNLFVLQGGLPIATSVPGPALYPMMTRAVLEAVPATLKRISNMQEEELKRFEKMTTLWGVTGGGAYYELASNPDVVRALKARRLELLGMASDPADLSFTERGQRNLPPTRGELLRLVTSIVMTDTQQSNRMEFVRTSDNTFADYSNSPLTGRIKTGETRVDIYDAKCPPAPKGRKCSFSVGIVRNYYLGDSPLHSKSLGLKEYTGVVQWGTHGLESPELKRDVVGWVRTRTGGGVGGRPNNHDDTDRDRDALNSGLKDLADAAQERRDEAQRRYKEDQDQRRERNRSCGPAPNICN